MHDERIDAYLVVGGKYHDFDFARLQLLTHLAGDGRVRVQVAADYEDCEAIATCRFLVSYTCDVRPSDTAQAALARYVARGGRWLALHGTNSAIDPPTSIEDQRAGRSSFTTPRAFPVFADTLGSQFLSHPKMDPYDVAISDGADDDPLVAGIEPFTVTDDELYLCEYHGDVVPLLETRWTGNSGPGFADNDWPVDEPRLVMYRRPLGSGEVVYLTPGHCRSHWDMIHPPFTAGTRYPKIERGAWDLEVYHELIRRGLAWARGEL